MKAREWALLLTIAALAVTALPQPVSPVRSAPASPAPESSPDKEEVREKPKERKVKLEAETVEYDEATTTYVATQATVELPDSDAVLRADRLEWNRSEKWMRATGKPRLWDTHNEIVAEVIRADLNLKRADAEGRVRLTARPKEAKTEQGKRARSHIKEPVVVHCDSLQYFYKDKRGTASGNLRITQKDAKADRTATGDRLSYDGNEETVILEGNVQVTNTRGEGFRCKQVVIRIKEGAEGFQVKGLTGGVFFVQEEEDNKDKKPEAGEGTSENPETGPTPSNGAGAAPAAPAPAGE